MMFTPGTGSAAGRVLSTFNAQCRLAVIYEEVRLRYLCLPQSFKGSA